jgi:hypothetical protein
MGDCIASVCIIVEVQENGIIRTQDGKFLGRMDEKRTFEELLNIPQVGDKK